MKQIRVFLFALFLCAPLVSVRAQTTAYDPTKFSTGLFKKGTYACPQTGKGGDPTLNELKNRDLPPPQIDTLTVARVLSQLPQDLPAGKGKKNYRSAWSATDAKRAEEFESKGAVIDGYLLEIKSQGKEACNCGSLQFHDYHLWLSAAPADPSKDLRSQAMVVEISPRLLGSHPNWNQKVIGRLVKQRSRVRISGWLTWDQEHPEQVGKTRGTLWEIHPIHKIEVFSSNQWREL